MPDGRLVTSVFNDMSLDLKLDPTRVVQTTKGAHPTEASSPARRDSTHCCIWALPCIAVGL